MEQPDDPKLVADPVLHAVLDHVRTIRGEAEQLAERHIAQRMLAKERLFDLLEGGESPADLLRIGWWRDRLLGRGALRKHDGCHWRCAWY